MAICTSTSVLVPHPLFDWSHHLVITVPLAPWRRPLGREVNIHPHLCQLGARYQLPFRPNSQSASACDQGQRDCPQEALKGDLLVVLNVVMPKTADEASRGAVANPMQDRPLRSTQRMDQASLTMDQPRCHISSIELRQCISLSRSPACWTDRRMDHHSPTAGDIAEKNGIFAPPALLPCTRRHAARRRTVRADIPRYSACEDVQPAQSPKTRPQTASTPV